MRGNSFLGLVIGWYRYPDIEMWKVLLFEDPRRTVWPIASVLVMHRRRNDSKRGHRSHRGWPNTGKQERSDMLIELCVFEESVAVVGVYAWVKKMHDNCVVWMDEGEEDAR